MDRLSIGIEIVIDIGIDIEKFETICNPRPSHSNHQSHDCLLNRLFKHRWKKISTLRVTGFCEGNSPVTSEFPAQTASNAEIVSIFLRHHAYSLP